MKYYCNNRNCSNELDPIRKGYGFSLCVDCAKAQENAVVKHQVPTNAGFSKFDGFLDARIGDLPVDTGGCKACPHNTKWQGRTQAGVAKPRYNTLIWSVINGTLDSISYPESGCDTCSVDPTHNLEFNEVEIARKGAINEQQQVDAQELRHEVYENHVAEALRQQVAYAHDLDRLGHSDQAYQVIMDILYDNADCHAMFSKHDYSMAEDGHVLYTMV